MRAEDRESILDELEARAVERTRAEAGQGGLPVVEVLEDSLYFERRRLRDDRQSPTWAEDTAFWDGVQRELARASSDGAAHLLSRVVRHYGQEIRGRFDPAVYKVVTHAIPPAMGLLLNAVSPGRLLRRSGGAPAATRGHELHRDTPPRCSGHVVLRNRIRGTLVTDS